MACGLLYTSIYRNWMFPSNCIAHALMNTCSQDGGNTVTTLCKFAEVEVTPEFYEVFSQGTPRDWLTRCEVTHTGSTAFTMKASLFLKTGSGVSGADSLCMNRMLLVRVNNQSKTFDPIPDGIKQKFLLSTDAKLTLSRICIPDTSPDAVFEYTIGEGCIDKNNHVNIYVYWWLIGKAIEEAESKSSYTKLQDQHAEALPSLRIKKCSIIYDKEVLLGETITVETWGTVDNNERCIYARLGQSRDVRILSKLVLHCTGGR